MTDEVRPVGELEGRDLDMAVLNELTSLGLRTADDDHVYFPDYDTVVCHVDDWAPSQEIDQAWALFEGLAELKIVADVTQWQEDHGTRTCRAEARECRKPFREWSAFGATAEAAICRMMLNVARADPPTPEAREDDGE